MESMRMWSDLSYEVEQMRDDVHPESRRVISARDLSYVGGLAPWDLRRDLETSCARARLTEAELGTCQTEIALLKSKNKIGEKERELLDHDLGDVKRTLGNVLERLKVLERGENATLKKRLTETETKLAWARMERDIAERRLHKSRVLNKIFYFAKRIMTPKAMSKACMRESRGGRAGVLEPVVAGAVVAGAGCARPAAS
ncbi:hypothetical protein Tco_0863969 [Tanacetum coccineum]